MPVSESQIIQEFRNFGVDELSTNVLDKLYEISHSCNVGPTDLVNEWLAFSLTNGQVTLNDETIGQFEAWRPSQNIKKSQKTPKTPISSREKTYSVEILDASLNESYKSDSSLLDAYYTPSSKAKFKRSPHTPNQIDGAAGKRWANANRTPKIAFSPTTFSPPAVNGSCQTPSQRYSTRSNAGDIVVRFGAAGQESVWSSSEQREVEVRAVSTADNLTPLDKPYKYMFQKLFDKAAVLNEMIDDVGDVLSEHYQISFGVSDEDGESSQVDIVGRVSCDSNGKINPNSALLETSAKYGRSVKLKLDLKDLQQFSIFPGQVIGARGSVVPTAGLTDVFACQQVYAGVPATASPPAVTLTHDIQLVVAAGPFTTSDCLTYEPLADLCSYLHNHNVQLCLLLGPFVDCKHEEIMKGNMNVTFEELFIEQLNMISSCTVGMCTKFVIVPSSRDVFHEPVYPTPPIQITSDKASGRPSSQYSHIQFVSDPCLLTVDGLSLALTSTDILFHLGSEEISVSPSSAGDRMQRLLSHVLTQHNFYPLFPPHADVSIDYDHYQSYCNIPHTPHVFICPSDLKCFIKDVSGCCCINPGRISKGQIGGTFCRVKISAADNVTSLSDHITAHVVKI